MRIAYAHSQMTTSLIRSLLALRYGHELPCNSLGACVAPEDAVKVFAIGDFEYKHVLCLIYSRTRN
jgi:hypothetical protein